MSRIVPNGCLIPDGGVTANLNRPRISGYRLTSRQIRCLLQRSGSFGNPSGGGPIRIFVSSSFEDLKEHRAAVIRVLRQLGHEVLAMEDMIAASATPLGRFWKWWTAARLM